MCASSTNMRTNFGSAASAGKIRLSTTGFWNPCSPCCRARKISAIPPWAILLTTWYRVPRAMDPENTSACYRRRVMEAGVPNAVGDWPAREYQAALNHLRKPSQLSQGLLLIAILALFLLVQNQYSVRALVILVSVLLFHEAGHLAGMRAFGYRDVTMFFFPFFGAAVSGKRRDVAAWKEGIVVLLGPVPGLVLGFAIAFFHRSPSPAIRELAVMLVDFNLFNLLPIVGLDGARLLQLLLFSRRRWLEIAFQLVTGLGAAALAVRWQNVVLFLLAPLMLLVLPFRWRVLKA